MTEELHEWQKEFKLKDDLFHGDFEALEMALFNMPRIISAMRKENLSIVNGSYLRAAIQADWIESPQCRALIDDKNGDRAYFYGDHNVDKMHPAAVDWLGARIDERYNIVKGEIPKAL